MLVQQPWPYLSSLSDHQRVLGWKWKSPTGISIEKCVTPEGAASYAARCSRSRMTKQGGLSSNEYPPPRVKSQEWALSSMTFGAPWELKRSTLHFYHLPTRRQIYAVKSEDPARQADDLILFLTGHTECLED